MLDRVALLLEVGDEALGGLFGLGAGLHRMRARRRFLVLPGGRAELAAFKLRRDPRLKAAMSKDDWVILKFRQVRQMAANTQLTRATLEPAFYADPLDEGPTQLALGA